MKSIFFLITILSSVTFAEPADYFARKETVTTSVLGQTSYTKHLDLTLSGQIRLNVYKTGEAKLLDTKLYGTVDPRIMGKLRAAVQSLPLESENSYSYRTRAVSGHESAITYIVLSQMGYIVVQTEGGPVRVHPKAKTLTSAPMAIRDLLDSYDVLTNTATYEDPKVGSYCVYQSFNGTETRGSLVGYIQNGFETDFTLQSPGCAAVRVVAGPNFKLEESTLQGDRVLAPFDKVKGYGYGVSVNGKFDEATKTLTADWGFVLPNAD